MRKKKEGGLILLIVIVVIAVFLSLIFLGVIIGIIANDSPLHNKNVAVIKINGPIMMGSGDGLFSPSVITPDKIIAKIEDADNNDKIKAIVFEINSPGGSPVATDEIAEQIKKTNKTTVAWIREVGASGAYWIASSTDHIVANRMSITGSIGVIGSYLEFGGLLEDYNVSYQRFVAGDYKDIGSPYRNLSVEERALYQNLLDRLHDFFIQEVATNRDLSVEDVRDIATGMIYLGADAKEIGLVDELGSKPEVKNYLRKKIGEPIEFDYYVDEPSLLDAFRMTADSLPIGKYINPMTPMLIK